MMCTNVLTTRQTAVLLGLSARTLNNAKDRGELPFQYLCYLVDYAGEQTQIPFSRLWTVTEKGQVMEEFNS